MNIPPSRIGWKNRLFCPKLTALAGPVLLCQAGRDAQKTEWGFDRATL